MPFLAKDPESGDLINILNTENAKAEISSGVVCPSCGSRLFVKSCSLRRDHFAHPPESDCDNKPESVKHELGKAKIFEMVSGREGVENVILEEYLPDISRRADVLVEYSGGQKMAHEIQISDISLNEIEERTNDYFSARISVCWWFGKEISEHVHEWCESNIGIWAQINFTRQRTQGGLE